MNEDLFTEKEKAEIIRINSEYWKQLISIQMHFNDLCIRTRWLFLIILSTIFALSLNLITDNDLLVKFNLFCNKELKLHFSAVAMFASLGIWYLFRSLDQKYYYRLLISAVEYTELFEKNSRYIRLNYPNDIGVTTFISGKVSRRDAKNIIIFLYNSTFITIILAFIFFLIYPNVR